MNKPTNDKDHMAYMDVLKMAEKLVNTLGPVFQLSIAAKMATEGVERIPDICPNCSGHGFDLIYPDGSWQTACMDCDLNIYGGPRFKELSQK
jgi:hypothetical protein